MVKVVEEEEIPVPRVVMISSIENIFKTPMKAHEFFDSRPVGTQVAKVKRLYYMWKDCVEHKNFMLFSVLQNMESSYSLADLETFVNRDLAGFESEDRPTDPGYFISDATRHIIKDNERIYFDVTLTNRNEFCSDSTHQYSSSDIDYVGAGFKKGTMVIYGSLKNYTGIQMLGGNLIVYGDTKKELGKWLDGGNIEIYGKVKAEFIAPFSTKGSIKIHGKEKLHWK